MCILPRRSIKFCSLFSAIVSHETYRRNEAPVDKIPLPPFTVCLGAPEWNTVSNCSCRRILQLSSLCVDREGTVFICNSVKNYICLLARFSNKCYCLHMRRCE